MTQKQIREDLKEIRYYYGRKEELDKAILTVENEVVQKAERYNQCVRKAAPRLFELYVELYIHCHTQAELASIWGFCKGYIQSLHQKLCAFFQSAFAKNEIKEVSNNV